MSEQTSPVVSPLMRIAQAWSRVGERLIPLLAVITALLVGIPLMVATGGQGDVAKGLRVSGQAYSALIEGALGLAIHDVASVDDFTLLRQYLATQPMPAERLVRQSNVFQRVTDFGADNLRRYEAFLADNPQLTEELIDSAAENLPAMRVIGAEPLRQARVTLQHLNEAGLSRTNVRNLADLVARKTTLTATEREQAAAIWPAMATLDGQALTDALITFTLIRDYSQVQIERFAEMMAVLDAEDVTIDGVQGDTLLEIAALNTGRVIEAFDTLKALDAANITDATALAEAVRLVDGLYTLDYLTAPTVNEALSTELDTVLSEHVFIRWPGGLLVSPDSTAQLVGSLQNAQGIPVLYARWGGSALLFFPANLEETLVRAVPYIIAGLAVALAFKAGLFNIGAEGQLHMGALLMVWVGFALPAALNTELAPLVHIPLAIGLGVIGGLLWGGISGVLKAFTGAHEVVTTIMLNFIALQLVDWLIKARDPVLLGDASAAQPKTPSILPSAMLPSFDELSAVWFILAGVAVMAILLWPKRATLNLNTLRGPVLMGLLVAGAGFVLQALSVTGALHIGFVLMVLCVWLVEWFLNRTTPGLELRTVGINPFAAQYAGMNVNLNVALAMALSGALAGLAGAIEVSGKTHVMLPALFAGYGFDSIAVALLGRSNPRTLPLAGFLWACLLSGASLMQVRAGIARDLVGILQGLIILFVAADQVIRFVWRIQTKK